MKRNILRHLAKGDFNFEKIRKKVVQVERCVRYGLIQFERKREDDEKKEKRKERAASSTPFSSSSSFSGAACLVSMGRRDVTWYSGRISAHQNLAARPPSRRRRLFNLQIYSRASRRPVVVMKIISKSISIQSLN